MTTLWDTTGGDVVKALAAERRSAGALAFGLVLTLVVVVDEKSVAAAEKAATTAAAAHPCRLLIVVRRQVEQTDRLDAEVLIGGRLGPGEAVVMRMYGRLSLHAESVVLPLLAPDAPVVTWFYGEPPERIAHDPLGVLADRRVTDTSMAPDSLAALHQRAVDYAPGDTDLAWSRTTWWRGLTAAAFDSVTSRPTRVTVTAGSGSSSAALLGGWLSARLGVPVETVRARGTGVTAIEVDFEPSDGSPDGPAASGDGPGGRPPVQGLSAGQPGQLRLERRDAGSALLTRTGAPDRLLPLGERDIGDLLAEELRRLDQDVPYAEALAAATGTSGLAGRSAVREHVWKDPAQSAAAEQVPA